jgi:autotransporter-associated beta strand protein
VLTGAGYSITNSSGTTTISAILGGSVALTKTGAGTLTLSGANTYSAGTTISAGTLALGANNVLANTGSVSVSGGTFDIGAFSDTVAAVTLSSGSITGSGGMLTGAGYSITNTVGTTLISANLAGNGSLTKIGAGTLVLSGVNTYTGGTTLDSGATLLLTNDDALSGNQLVSNNGILMLGNDVVLPSLTVNGNVTLASDVKTMGSQVYNNQVTISKNQRLNPESLVNYEVVPLEITSFNNAIQFNGTLVAAANTYAIKRSLTINANNGSVTFNDRLGEDSMEYSIYSALVGRGVKNLYNLTINASSINLNADVTTLETQTYNAPVIIGDNGSNGTTRTILSVDPKVEFMYSIDVYFQYAYANC